MARSARVPRTSRPRIPGRTRGRWFAVAFAGTSFVLPVAASAAPARDANASSRAHALPSSVKSPLRTPADVTPFARSPASRSARDLHAWILKSGDNQTLPFVIIDKVEAKVFVFARDGQVRGTAAALLGLGRGDETVPGIGQRKLSTIRPEERTTPAGRFQASLGHDFEQDILWVDYDAALSLHRVIAGNPRDRRHARLASASPDDNRISYGCINVPADFYDGVVVPAFTGTVGIVYILPETRSPEEVFAMRTVSATGGTIAKPPIR